MTDGGFMKNEDMKEKDFENEDITVTLTLDDDSELECQVLTVLDAGDGKSFIALLPLTGPEAETGNVFLYRYSDANGEPELSNIETDEEYEIASDLFDEYLDSVEFDELITEDEE